MSVQMLKMLKFVCDDCDAMYYFLTKKAFLYLLTDRTEEKKKTRKLWLLLFFIFFSTFICLFVLMSLTEGSKRAFSILFFFLQLFNSRCLLMP